MYGERIDICHTLAVQSAWGLRGVAIAFHVLGAMPKKSTTIRLSDEGQRRLEFWAARLNKTATEIQELALAHFDGTARRDLPIYITDPAPTRPGNGGDQHA
jgi:hypothetical protein